MFISIEHLKIFLGGDFAASVQYIATIYYNWNGPHTRVSFNEMIMMMIMMMIMIMIMIWSSWKSYEGFLTYIPGSASIIL